jgi:hypothetical protein
MNPAGELKGPRAFIHNCTNARQLGRVVKPFLLAVFDTWHNLYHGCSLALQFISDQNPRRISQFLEKLAEELFGCLPIAPASHEDIERMTLLIEARHR